MKRRSFFLLVISLFAFTAASCSKEDGLEVKEATATLHWSGDDTVDGCGFSIALSNKLYKPENEQDIGSNFKKEEPSTVKLKYTLPGKKLQTVCNAGKQEAESIRVISIKQ